MANITKRDNGSYRIRVCIGRDKSGKQIVESMTYSPVATTPKRIEKEVAQAAAEFEEKVKNGAFLDGERISFEEYIETWEKEWATTNLTLGALESYKAIFETRINPTIGRLPIGTIRPAHLQAIVSRMNDEGKAAKTIRRTLTAVNSVMKYAYDMELIESNPVSRVRAPKASKREELHYFTPEQAKAFLEALKADNEHTVKAHASTSRHDGSALSIREYTRTFSPAFQWQVYFNLAIYGGFRRGELCALRWSDIDFKKSTVSIKRAFQKTKEQGQIIKSTKTQSGYRTLTMPSSSMELLHEWRTKQKEMCLALGSSWLGQRGKDYDSNYVFIQLDNGLAMNVDSPAHKMQKVIRAYNEKCEREEDKLPNIRLHDLRHTSATLLISQGVDIATVSHRLGHSQVSVTLDVYSHWMEPKDKEASEVLESLLS